MQIVTVIVMTVASVRMSEVKQMNNRYLYKAKRKDNGEWVEGYYAYIRPYHYMMPKDNFDTWFEVDENTLCQCTGLKDKNGKLIWENEICVIRSNPIDEEDGYFTVGWDNDGARFKLESDELVFDFDDIHSYECEVVGSIFDNPELLEGGEN